jgi:uncharacterized protein (TIGR03067 family)
VLAEDKAATLKAEMKKFSGIWKVEVGTADNQPLPGDGLSKAKIVFEDNTFAFKGGPIDQLTTFKIDPEQKSIEIAPPLGEKQTLRGLYKFDGNKLVLCVTDGEKVPDKLEGGANRLYLVLTKEK